ncbi:MAG: hypothetical protein KDH96_05075 [Candidatus Riesia sp.]|nr:hypothetical protein [Candidatus Riesia sp.]
MKAIIINRFGDFGLYFAILLIFCFYKSLSFTTINTISFLNINYINFLNYSFSINELIAFFFFIAVIGKSAQLGLHT